MNITSSPCNVSDIRVQIGLLRHSGQVIMSELKLVLIVLLVCHFQPTGRGARPPEAYCIISRVACFGLFSKVSGLMQRVEKIIHDSQHLNMSRVLFSTAEPLEIEVVQAISLDKPA